MKSTPNQRIYRYQLKESALDAYRQFSVLDRVGGLASCSMFAPLKSFCIGVHPDGSTALYGLNKCHCRSSCPICALGRDVSCLGEIQHGIWHARKMGLGVYLQTFTFAHGWADSLRGLQTAFSTARQLLYRDGSYRRFMGSLGYVGRITDYEVQLCGRNGYHPHSHELLFMDAGVDLDYIRDVVADYYLDALSKVGLSARRDISVSVQGYEGVGDYISKMSAEITLGNHTKKSWDGESMSPFQCLEQWHLTRNKFYALWWIDYVISVKGKRMLGWSRGLKQKLGVSSEYDGMIEDRGDYRPLLVFDADCVNTLTPSQWRTIAESVNGRNLDYVLDCLNRLGISKYVNPDALRIYEEAF